MKKRFDGMYYKHQKGEQTISIIAGVSSGNHAFIQVITNNDSHYFKYPMSVCKFGDTIEIADNTFSKNGVKININENDIMIFGEMKYIELTPLRYDIMGPFKYLPMECRHKILSLHHRIDGGLSFNGRFIDFTGGIGYIEGDSGKSFPKNYTWIQCNNFSDKACVSVAVADIPFSGLHFQGCIGIVYFNGVEYRMATYLGVKIICCDENRIILQQGKLYLDIEIGAGTGYKLIAPNKGGMDREIREFVVCGAKFRFMKGEVILFERHADSASFEYINEKTTERMI